MIALKVDELDYCDQVYYISEDDMEFVNGGAWSWKSFYKSGLSGAAAGYSATGTAEGAASGMVTGLGLYAGFGWW